MSRYDSIIVGGGHNGLVCASYLARAGQRVLVLEASAMPGGLAATREFHSGFRAAVAHSVSHFSKRIEKDLDLAAHGFRTGPNPPRLLGLGVGGEHVVVDGEALHGVSAADAEAYRDYAARMRRFADMLAPFWLRTMPRIGGGSLREILTFARLGLDLRRLGKRQLREFLRVFSLPARDLMDEAFEGERLKAMLSWDGLIGSKMAPRSPNNAVPALMYRMSGASGGVRSLAEALHSAAVAAGAEIRCSAEVARILIESDGHGPKAMGVRLAGGDTLQADCVVSATDPQRTFLKLVGVEYLDIGFANRIRRLRCQGYVAKLHLALEGLPEFEGLDHPDGRLIVAPDLDAIEFAFDDAKYGRCSGDPVMEIVVPSIRDASLAPPGQHVLSAHVMYVPYVLKGGWNDAARERICDLAIDTLERYAPRIREQILHQEFLTPRDLETKYRVSGGHWHHTEYALDQMLMMRPTYGAAQYATPIQGLFLCGAGCHPGGDLVGGAGHNAAREILR